MKIRSKHQFLKTKYCPLKESYLLSQSRLVLPKHLNDQEMLFGGNALKWMDETAYLTAKSFTGQSLVTARIKDVKFIKPIRVGMTLNISAEIVRCTRFHLTVLTEVWIINSQNPESEKAVSGSFIFTAVDPAGRLATLLPYSGFSES
ncbi:MAG: acyl-CoA thioesterase [Alphaproteobacteria bacterium]|nr:acyl-CoA thioesterase [Alphaproteobacteria bacterium]